MISINREYFRTRADEHRRLAQQARSDNVAGLHLQLAQNYDELASAHVADNGQSRETDNSSDPRTSLANPIHYDGSRAGEGQPRA